MRGICMIAVRTRSALTAMSDFLSLRNHRRTVGRSDGPSFRFRWSDDGQEIFWDEHRLTMTQFRLISQIVLGTANSHCARLMYDWSPSCALDGIQDCLAVNAFGYSFVTEPSNALGDKHLELSRRACLSTIDGLMSDNGWNDVAVHRYMTLHEEFLRQLLTLAYLTGGQAPRGTELLSIECVNTASTSRGACVYKGKMILISRHNKSRRMTNNEFLVVRYLPRGPSELFFLYLVYIRPFVALLQRVCLRQQPLGSLLFGDSESGKPWKTDVLSKALQSSIPASLGFGWGTRVYRQISIAITEKYLKHVSQPFDRHKDRTSDADPDVGFAWQSGHRPLQRSTTYGIDGAFPDSLQPALLHIYERVSSEWHRWIDPPKSSPAEATAGSQASAATKRRLIEPDGMTFTSPKKCPAIGQQPSTVDDGVGASTQTNPASHVKQIWMTSREMDLYRTAPKLPWPGCVPLLGRYTEDATSRQYERAEIVRHMTVREDEIIRTSSYHSIWSGNQDRFKRWRNVGCQLCYAESGRPEPDHDLKDCDRWPGSERAWQAFCRLDKLALPRHSRWGWGSCSLCSGPAALCKGMHLAEQMHQVSGDDMKTVFRREYDAITGPDYGCDNKRAVKQSIAALCAYKSHILGNALATKLYTEAVIDFAAENHVDMWIRQHTSFGDEPGSVIRLYYVFELLVSAFDLHRPGTAKNLEDSSNPSGDLVEDHPKWAWGDKQEVQNWREAVDW